MRVTRYKQAHTEDFRPFVMPYIIKLNLKSLYYSDEFGFRYRSKQRVQFEYLRKFINGTF